MPLTGASTLVSFDGDAATAAVREAAGDGVASVSAFTTDDFEILYVSDDVLALYRDEAHLREHYDEVLSHLNMDILEKEVYEGTLLPNAGRVRASVTYMDDLTLLRVVVEEEGLYIALQPDAPVRTVVDAVEPVLFD
ncbi:DUF7522 family protein [Halosegnis marinus]|uniref:Roadblock/LAMTOR2 domain-containing protein n=1 Tax=Halosegnis marinus TaxID=3034023 RepID=A0ABD5ZMN8_9EURY|nr:hypothetical protein [Halosegnis sp. DT85]